MADHVSTAKRSEMMAAVRSKHTSPEIAVRKLIFGMGFRYRLHSKGLPGHPDLVFASRKKVIFVHGCFWHRHKGCRYTTNPKTRIDFWQNKFDTNVARDRRVVKELRKLGWKAMIVWQCELKEPRRLTERLDEFLSSDEKAEQG